MKSNEGRFEKLADLPKVADPCADQAVVRKVPEYNGVRIVLESGFLEETASPVTIVHDLFVLCAFYKADVVRVDLKKLFSCYIFTFLHGKSIDGRKKELLNRILVHLISGPPVHQLGLQVRP